MFYQKINSLNRPHLFTRARTEQIFERTNFLPMSPVLALPGTGEILLHVVLFTLVLNNFLQVSALEWLFFYQSRVTWLYAFTSQTMQKLARLEVNTSPLKSGTVPVKNSDLLLIS